MVVVATVVVEAEKANAGLDHLNAVHDHQNKGKSLLVAVHAVGLMYKVCTVVAVVPTSFVVEG